MALKITEVQQTFSDNNGTMTVMLVANQKGQSTNQMVLCEKRADTYDGLGEKVCKAITWNGSVATVSFTKDERSKFTKEMYVTIDSGTSGSHELCNICCIFLGAPVISFYRVTEQNELLLYPDRSKRDTCLASDMRCGFTDSDSAQAPVLGWSARLELYNLQNTSSITAKLSYSYTDKSANAPVFGPSATQTLLIASPNITSIACTAQSGSTSSDLTATAEGSTTPAKLQATLYSNACMVTEKELAKSSSSYKWTGLPKLDPSGNYCVSFCSKCDLGFSKPTKKFPLLTALPAPERCNYSSGGATIHMAQDATYEVKIGTAAAVVHVGKNITLSSVPASDPVIRMTRDGSFGPSLTYTLSNPAYYSLKKDSLTYYKYGTKPLSACGEIKLTLTEELPAYSGKYFKTSGKTLTITADTFASSSTVSSIHTDYTTLLTKCTGSVQIKAIRAAILVNMPMRTDDMLFYHYQYNPYSGYIDLCSGMGLLVENTNYQYIPDDIRENKLAKTSEKQTPYNYELNGYTGAGTEMISVIERGGKLRFDSFVSGMTDSGWLIVPPPSEIKDNNNLCGGAGVFDLQFSAMSKPFVRLVYPQTVVGRDDAGSLKYYENVCLMSADTTALLDSAVKLMQRANDDTTAQAFVQSVGITSFRGRSAVIPKIKIYVNDTSVWISVGTLLGDLMQEHRAAALSLYRQSSAGLCPMPDAGSDMPLLSGDSIHFI